MKIFAANKIISEDCFVADNFLLKLFGKIFIDKDILLKDCNSIHTIFLNKSIDVVFLNNSNQIIKLISELPKNTIIFPVKNSVNVIEFGAGFLKDANINVGDILTFEYE